MKKRHHEGVGRKEVDTSTRLGLQGLWCPSVRGASVSGKIDHLQAKPWLKQCAEVGLGCRTMSGKRRLSDGKPREELLIYLPPPMEQRE